MCFWVDAETLEPLGCSVYDAYAFSDPEPVPSMHVNEWSLRRVGQWLAMREKERVATYPDDITGGPARSEALG